MPLEHALWRIGNSLARLPVAKMDTEDLLEDYIFRDITILNDGWLIIGRQVLTDFGKFIDLLAVDETGALIVIELKKDQTPREVVAQAIGLCGLGSKPYERQDCGHFSGIHFALPPGPRPQDLG